MPSNRFIRSDLKRPRREPVLSVHEIETAQSLHLERLTEYAQALLSFIENMDCLTDAVELPHEDLADAYTIVKAFIELKDIKNVSVLPLTAIEIYPTDTDVYQVGQAAIIYLEGLKVIHALAQVAWERLQNQPLSGMALDLAQRLQDWAQDLSPQVWTYYDHPNSARQQSMSDYRTQIFSSPFYKKYMARAQKKTLQG